LIDEIQKTIAHQLFECAADAGNSEHKRAYLAALPALVLTQAEHIAQGRYHPQPFTVFAVTDPKLREIFAPAFVDRLVHQWLVRHIEPWWDKRFIDDSYANRKGKGTQKAIERLQHFMRQPHQRWYCQLDIRAFFPSINRHILLGFWRKALPTLPWDSSTRTRLDQVTTAILMQSPTSPPPIPSGDRALLAQIPPHKSLYHTEPGVGLPIGSLTSQFFANVYLNEMDQFIKHHLKVKGYLRYVDDFVLLGDDPEVLMGQRQAISQFLGERLGLQLHPSKMVLQRCNQGVDFLGSIVFPHHSLTRQRSVRALRRRLSWFKYLLSSQTERPVPAPPMGSWQRWLALHEAFVAPGVPSPALLQRMLATINSYYGFFVHAHTFRLRKHIYHKELGSLQRYFLPDGAGYTHLQIRKVWLSPRI
jgi:RNA-directed DNA polymerase